MTKMDDLSNLISSFIFTTSVYIYIVRLYFVSTTQRRVHNQGPICISLSLKRRGIPFPNEGSRGASPLGSMIPDPPS